ncbi:MAG: prepilin peptidase [Spirochaetia bacterium]|nr:prepilin peptidase [Spirochaetia bacterium]
MSPTHPFALAFASVLGLLIGSFYTATASRVLYFVYGPARKIPNRWKEFFTARSFCMQCDAPIKRLYLIPVAGYFLSKGKCASCGGRIGRLTLVGEALPGILFPVLLLGGMKAFAALCTIFLLGHLYISIATDANFFLLDHENAAFLGVFAVAAVLDQTGFSWTDIQPHALSALGVLVLFLLLFAVVRGRGLGFGDVILAPILAFHAGFPWVLILFQAAALGSIVYVALIKRDRTTPIPFGAFMAGSWMLAVFARSVWAWKESGFYFPYT